MRARRVVLTLLAVLAIAGIARDVRGRAASAQEAAPVADWKSPDYAKIFGDPDDEKDHEKRLTAYMIGVRRVKSAMPILNGVVTSHRSPLVREAAAWALGRIGDFASIAPLEKAMTDPDPRVRAAAIDAIGNYDVTDTFAMLEKIANGPTRCR
ncbi:MAG: HEAT repeat domain-containing protein [Deltaproteobacteria bacterium]|nr:HEAT repeat domain-containing protein [Deltaproteobacteria bacterium]